MAAASTFSSTASSSPQGVPWYIWCSVLAVTSAMIGGHWDISWHRSIGRDTFWTPAHIAIYLCGVMAGISCGYLILSTTFGRLSSLRPASVEIWKFRGPLGAFIAAWGGIAMLTSAPFDDWWHTAYGLDVKIMSPPHVLLITGILAVEAGALILILGSMNRADGEMRRKLSRLFLYVGAMILIVLLVLVMEFTSRIFMHNAFFYRILAMVVPVVLVGIPTASERRWSATTIAGIYTVFLLGLEWILPLFPAEPKLGPVMQHVTHFIPPEFPLLLIVPAFLLDLLRPTLSRRNRWLHAAAAGLLFLAGIVAAQWPFGDFLMGPWSRNWFFGTQYFQYNASPNWYAVRNVFFQQEAPGAFWTQMGIALAAAILTTRLGLAWGAWMQRVRR